MPCWVGVGDDADKGLLGIKGPGQRYEGSLHELSPAKISNTPFDNLLQGGDRGGYRSFWLSFFGEKGSSAWIGHFERFNFFIRTHGNIYIVLDGVARASARVSCPWFSIRIQ